MNGFVISQEVLFACALASALLCCAALVLASVAVRRAKQSARSALALASELEIFKDAAVTLGQRLSSPGPAPASRPSVAPAAELRRLPEAVVPVQRPRAHADIEVFERARRGVSVDELVATTDVSRSEASLVLALARGRR